MTIGLRRSGSARQGGLSRQISDTMHERIYYPVVGVILNVFCSDETTNSNSSVFQDGRGYTCQARVKIVNDGTDKPTILPNVTVIPPSGSGADDFTEHIPKGTTGTIDGTAVKSNFEDIPAAKLNGDWCVVQFVGGSIHQPIMVSWFPHPSNRRDPATSGTAVGALAQGRRIAKRFQGTKSVITSKGTMFLDTSEANQPLQNDQMTRTKNAEGGDINVTVKKERQLEINFNPPVFNEDEPDFMWSDQIPKERETTATSLTMDQNFIKAVAGQVIEMQAQNLYMGTESTADENFVLGQAWKTMMEALLDAINKITVPTAFGPSGTPINAAEFTQIKTQLDQQLSDWIFGQKVAPK